MPQTIVQTHSIHFKWSPATSSADPPTIYIIEASFNLIIILLPRNLKRISPQWLIIDCSPPRPHNNKFIIQTDPIRHFIKVKMYCQDILVVTKLDKLRGHSTSMLWKNRNHMEAGIISLNCSSVSILSTLNQWVLSNNQ